MRMLSLWLTCFMLATGLLHAVEPTPQFRYPVAATRLDAHTLVVANERSGTLSLVDLRREIVVDELRAGQRLTDAAVSPRGLILVTDAAADELVAVQRRDDRLQEVARIAISRDPASVVVAPDGCEAYVVSRWSRQLDIIAIQADGNLTLQKSLPLPFPARRQLVLPDGKHLLVADAFGGRLAVVDLASRAIMARRQFHGHHLHGLAWDGAGDRLLIAHQVLNAPLPVTLDNVQWGAVMKNVVREMTLAQLLDPRVNLETATRIYALGQEGDGSADPSAVLPLADGGFAVALAGANELAIIESTGLVTNRVPLSGRPVALLAGRDFNELIAVAPFENALHLVDLPRARTRSISLGTAPAPGPAQRGERLFYDARLSFDRWMSCHSCHTDGHTQGQLADTLGDGSYGAPKRTLTLLGTRLTDSWAWNGQVRELHEQVRKSVETSMHGEVTDQEIFDLTAFLHTLDPPPPLLPPANDADRRLIERGRVVFERHKCSQCHIGPLTYTSHGVYDVGLADERGERKFNPPSLRGVGQGTSFFHDGRATSLEDVVDLFGHQLSAPLESEERDALLRFLRSL